jgi:hypothetical protein
MPLPSMPRAPRTPSAASPARSRSCDSRTPQECGRDIVGSYTLRPFRLSCPALISLQMTCQGLDLKRDRNQELLVGPMRS